MSFTSFSPSFPQLYFSRSSNCNKSLSYPLSSPVFSPIDTITRVKYYYQYLVEDSCTSLAQMQLAGGLIRSTSLERSKQLDTFTFTFRNLFLFSLTFLSVLFHHLSYSHQIIHFFIIQSSPSFHSSK